jgi:hypothetical protein
MMEDFVRQYKNDYEFFESSAQVVEALRQEDEKLALDNFLDWS